MRLERLPEKKRFCGVHDIKAAARESSRCEVSSRVALSSRLDIWRHPGDLESEGYDGYDRYAE